MYLTRVLCSAHFYDRVIHYYVWQPRRSPQTWRSLPVYLPEICVPTSTAPVKVTKPCFSWILLEVRSLNHLCRHAHCCCWNISTPVSCISLFCSRPPLRRCTYQTRGGPWHHICRNLQLIRNELAQLKERDSQQPHTDTNNINATERVPSELL